MSAASFDIDRLRFEASTAHGAARPAWWALRRPPDQPRAAAGGRLMAELLGRMGEHWRVQRYSTQNRRTLCAQITDGRTRAVAKIRLEADGCHDMEKEYAALSTAAAACGPALVPDPIAFYRDLHGIVMSAMPGKSLNHAWARQRRSRTMILTETGRALARFHQATGCADKIAGQIWHEKTVPLAVRAACSTQTEHSWADRVLAAYLDGARRTAETPVPFGFTHEDLLPSNVLVAEGRIAFIDFENAQRTHCLNDLARLTIGLQMLCGTPKPWRRHDQFGLGFDARILTPLCAGYGLATRYEAHFATILLRGCLQIWARSKSRAHRRQGYRTDRDRAFRMADRLARALG